MALLRLISVTCHFIGFLASPCSITTTTTTTTASPLAQEYGDYEYDYEYDYDVIIGSSAKVNLDDLPQLYEDYGLDYGEQKGGFEVDFLTGGDLGVCQLPPELMENGNGM